MHSSWQRILLHGTEPACLRSVCGTDAQVVAVGSGRVDEKTEEVVKPNVQTGSTVLYSKYAGTEFSGDDDKEYIVVRETDIIATLA